MVMNFFFSTAAIKNQCCSYFDSKNSISFYLDFLCASLFQPPFTINYRGGEIFVTKPGNCCKYKPRWGLEKHLQLLPGLHVLCYFWPFRYHIHGSRLLHQKRHLTVKPIMFCFFFRFPIHSESYAAQNSWQETEVSILGEKKNGNKVSPTPTVLKPSLS